jgi:hypothetical protein
MGRTYAGILGPLGFALVVARGVATLGGVEATLLAASAALFVFAVIGYFVGQTANYLVNDSVRSQFHQAMAEWNEKEKQQGKTQTAK